MSRLASRLFQAIALMLLLVSIRPGFAGGPKTIYRQTLRSTALVVTSDGSGTGWLADSAGKLLVTNQHVVGNQDKVTVLFPQYQSGQPIAERDHYLKHGRPIRGQVLDTDAQRDLAVIELESLPEGVVAMKLAAASPEPGEAVHSIGNPGASGALWVYTSGPVRALYWYEGLYAGHPLKARIIESQSPINPGDSGGPVVNDQGELVGVVMGANTKGQLLSHQIDVGEVKVFLDRVRPLANPRSAADYNRRGESFKGKKHYTQALANFTKALRLEQAHVPALLNRAFVYNELGRFEDAIADCDQIVNRDPNNSTAYRERGFAHGQNEEYEQAIHDLSKAVELNPKDLSAKRYLEEVVRKKK